jgi:hypothetical protein
VDFGLSLELGAEGLGLRSFVCAVVLIAISAPDHAPGADARGVLLTERHAVMLDPPVERQGEPRPLL